MNIITKTLIGAILCTTLIGCDKVDYQIPSHSDSLESTQSFTPHLIDSREDIMRETKRNLEIGVYGQDYVDSKELRDRQLKELRDKQGNNY